jgi:hypothetical protein
MGLPCPLPPLAAAAVAFAQGAELIGPRCPLPRPTLRAGCATHLALNWWFHPPDRLAPSEAAFERPYTSDYWPTLWQARLARLRAAGAGGGDGGGGGGGGGGAGSERRRAGGSGELRERRTGGVRKRRAGGASAPAHVRWPGGLHEPSNRYYRGNTHPGTASGTAAAWPPPRPKGEPPGGGGGGGGDSGVGDEEEHEPEDAVAAYFRANPDAARALFAQFLASKYGPGGGGTDDRGGAHGARGRASPLAAGRRHHVPVAYRMRKRVPKPHPNMG